MRRGGRHADAAPAGTPEGREHARRPLELGPGSSARPGAGPRPLRHITRTDHEDPPDGGRMMSICCRHHACLRHAPLPPSELISPHTGEHLRPHKPCNASPGGGRREAPPRSIRNHARPAGRLPTSRLRRSDPSGRQCSADDCRRTDHHPVTVAPTGSGPEHRATPSCGTCAVGPACPSGRLRSRPLPQRRRQLRPPSGARRLAACGCHRQVQRRRVQLQPAPPGHLLAPRRRRGLVLTGPRCPVSCPVGLVGAAGFEPATPRL